MIAVIVFAVGFLCSAIALILHMWSDKRKDMTFYEYYAYSDGQEMLVCLFALSAMCLISTLRQYLGGS
jgi:elongation factor P hydroxylase